VDFGIIVDSRSAVGSGVSFSPTGTVEAGGFVVIGGGSVDLSGTIVEGWMRVDAGIAVWTGVSFSGTKTVEAGTLAVGTISVSSGTVSACS
jgi:hypothetical protein